jgi:hypothetical protein
MTTTITTEQAKKIMRIRNWSDAIVGGILVARMDGEFKFSPNHATGSLDSGAYFMDREDVKEIAAAK